jgi:glycosyltransferase involved in cell wall biosynthesis
VNLRLVLPGDPATRTGGYEYDRRIADGLRRRGWRVDVHPLGAGFPRPSADELAAAGEVLAAFADGTRVLVDGLAFGAMPHVAAREARRLRLAALVHHPLAMETGLPAHEAARLRETERAALAHAGRVIATSAATARALADYDVPHERLEVVVPGTDPAPLARGSGTGPIRLVCVATLVPRKGHDTLIDALGDLADLPWRLSCVGSLDRDPAWAASIAARIRARGLGDRVTLAGELAPDALGQAYAEADAFVLATHHEGYGMALAEALARGLPVVSTRAGAVPETVPADAGLLVPPGDVAALRDALHRLLSDAALRARLAAGAQRARLALPTWDEAAARMAAALSR